MKVKFYLVDDSEPFRNAIKLFIESELGHIVIGEASDGSIAVSDQTIKDCDIVLMDIMMKEMDGITAAKKLLWENPNLRIIAITGNEEAVFLRLLVNSGFYGCVFKNQIFNELNEAIDIVMKGKRSFPSRIKI